MEARKIPVLTDEIKKEIAENLEIGFEVFIKRQTGEFFMRIGDGTYEDEDEILEEERELREEFERDPDAFLAITAPPSYQSYNWMKEFAMTQVKGTLQNRLLDLLTHRKPFANFNRFVIHEGPPELRDKWQIFKEASLLAYVNYELASVDNRNDAFSDEDDEDLEEMEDDEDDDLENDPDLELEGDDDEDR